MMPSGAPASGSRAAAQTVRAVPGRRSEKMHFHPQRWAKVYDHWLTNIQDWCISRQLWWGHQFQCGMVIGNQADEKRESLTA